MAVCTSATRRTRTHRRRVLIALPLALSLALSLGVSSSLSPVAAADVPESASPAPSSPRDMATLLDRYARMPGFEARFDESKLISILAVPLTSHGRLYYLPSSEEVPDPLLLRRVVSPHPQDVLISHDAIRIRSEGRTERLSLDAQDQIRPLVESLVWLFSGNLEALRGAYTVDFATDIVGESERGDPDSNSERWRLALTPRNPDLALLISALTVSGTGYSTERVEIAESSGDKTILAISEADPDRRFTKSERAALFGVAESHD